MKKKVLSIILALVMVAGMLPFGAITAFAENVPEGTGKYISRSWDGTKKQVVSTETDIPTGATLLTSNMTAWQSGWYVADGEVEISSAKVQVTGNVNLVLKDDCELTVSKGITVSEDGVLTVYAQKNGTGELTATGQYYDAGIGTNYAADQNKTGTVNIHGGKIKAVGGSFGGAGIGNGAYGVSGCKCNVVIYGGKIEAVGGTEGGAGIGGGKSGINWNETDGLTACGHIGNITIYGGNITASGGYNSAGIGGGNGCDGGSIAILGGNITATGGETSDLASDDARAIGCGWFDGMKTQGMSSIVAYSAPVGAGSITIGENMTVRDGGGNAVTLPEGKTWAQTLTGKYYTVSDGSAHTHDFTGDYVDNGDGTHSRKCTECDEVGEAENHTFVNHICVCGATSEHSFTGDYVNNGDGTHSRKCTGCGEISTPEAHTYVDHVCACGAKEILGKYIDRRWDEDSKQVISTEVDIPSGAKSITANTTELSGGWYILSENIETESRIVVKGTADNPTNIILLDGVTLEAKDGIEVNEGYVLNIYGQKNDTGKIVAQSDRSHKAGIGGYGGNGGTVTVNGGTVSATSYSGAGIGGGNAGIGGTVTVNGGTVTATSKLGAGIGGGKQGNGGIVTVNGGTVTATSESGAGIGGGYGYDIGGDGGTVTVNGGTVTATSINGAGIGGAKEKGGGNITINGGTVTATSFSGAGIGAGMDSIAHGGFTVADGLTIKAGDDADNAGVVTAEEYSTSRNPYISITPTHIHDFTGDYVDNGDGTHSRKCTGCDELDTPEVHTFENYTCVCGLHNWGKYIDRRWDAESKQVISTELDIPSDAEEITANTTYLLGGWYVVANSFETSKTIKLMTNAHIVLLDGATLTTTAGINVEYPFSLNIYGQKNDTGGIFANLSNDFNSNAAIGSTQRSDDSGFITINGGIVTVKSDRGAGIGGGDQCNGGTVTVNGGTVTATSISGAGIGGGCRKKNGGGGAGGTVTVNGGTVTATSEYGAGIGGGRDGNGGTLIVNGGTVTAASGQVACIGGGTEPEGYGVIRVADGLSMKAGWSADAVKTVKVSNYKIYGYTYVKIHNKHGEQFVKCAVNVAGGTPGNCTVTLTDTENTENVYNGVTEGENIYYVDNVADGTYILTVTADGAVTRTYTVTVNGCTATVPAELYAEGDVNGDGEITAEDYSAAVNAALASDSSVPADLSADADYQKAAADLDGDGFVDVLDIALLERKIF